MRGKSWGVKLLLAAGEAPPVPPDVMTGSPDATPRAPERRTPFECSVSLITTCIVSLRTSLLAMAEPKRGGGAGQTVTPNGEPAHMPWAMSTIGRTSC